MYVFGLKPLSSRDRQVILSGYSISMVMHGLLLGNNNTKNNERSSALWQNNLDLEYENSLKWYKCTNSLTCGVHVYKQHMPDKTDTEDGMTKCRSYSRHAVNSLCETIRKRNVCPSFCPSVGQCSHVDRFFIYGIFTGIFILIKWITINETLLYFITLNACKVRFWGFTLFLFCFLFL